jgi:hypothetical protein
MATHHRLAFGLIRHTWWPAPATRKALRLGLATRASARGLFIAEIIELERAPIRDQLLLEHLTKLLRQAVDRDGNAVLVTNQPLDPRTLDPDWDRRKITVITIDLVRRPSKSLTSSVPVQRSHAPTIEGE